MVLFRKCLDNSKNILTVLKTAKGQPKKTFFHRTTYQLSTSNNCQGINIDRARGFGPRTATMRGGGVMLILTWPLYQCGCYQ